MNRELLISCWPYLAAIGGSLLAARLLIWLSGARLRVAHAAALHADEHGSVQSLSFVLTLPLFMLIMLFIVQLSQVIIAKFVVEYAAFAAARSAVVWIPASLGPGQEQENQISTYSYLGEFTDEDDIIFQRYGVAPDSPKFNKVHLAAAMACLPLAPSRRMDAKPHEGNAALPSIRKAYRAVSPASVGNSQVPQRLANKLAYSLANTNIRIEIRHAVDEPPLAPHGVPPYLEEFAPNEISWKDQIVVSVAHDFALLPGPAYLMASPAASAGSTGGSLSDGGTGSSGTLSQTYGGGTPPSSPGSRPMAGGGRVYIKRLTATCRLSNEGEKSLLPYVQRLDGVPTPSDGPWAPPSNPTGDNPSPGDPTTDDRRTVN